MSQKTIGKLGNVGLAGVAWETSQVYFTSADARTGVQVLPAPELYSRQNKITSLDISCGTGGTLVSLSGNGATPEVSFLTVANSPIHINYDDPLVFPTGVSTKVITSAAANLYITAKYFVE